MMANWFEVSNTAGPGQIPDTVKWSFYLGGAVFLAAVSWTVFSSKEYSPEEIAAFEAGEEEAEAFEEIEPRPAAKYRNGGLGWIVAGAALLAWIALRDLDKQLYILAIGGIAFGLLQIVTGQMQNAGRTDNGLYHIVEDLFNMPRVMKQLAVVQFFSWFALFAMWIYSTAAVTAHHFGATDVTGQAYNDGANWVGVLFASYNGFAALAAIAIPIVVHRLGCRRSHLLNLLIGGAGLISFLFIQDPAWLIVPMIGVGIAWASILSLPYALLSDVLPTAKMGIYMGIFNFFIVIPQLIAASVLGLVLREFFSANAIYGLVLGGVCMIVAGFATLMVDKEAEPESVR
jgi:maltose/moltooligosaccharide transporter